MDRPIVKQIIYPSGRGKKVMALDRIDFEVESGRILGVVGANGAGKTTLLRILANVLSASIGEVLICGKVLKSSDASLRRSIGYVSSDDRSFFWRLSGRQNLDFFGRLYGLHGSRLKKRITEVLQTFNFTDKADVSFKDYSAGMRKKMSLMRAMLHRPVVLLLDEVTNSLDIESCKMVKESVRDYISNDNQCAAIWSTHRLEELDEVCDNVLGLDCGRIKFIKKERSSAISKIAADNFLLRASNMNGKFDAFLDRFCDKMIVEASRDGQIGEFLFKQISGEEFGQVVTVAIQDYGAYVVFAGCMNKKSIDCNR
jgi:ABC-2 type transport system ATP-binding protein